MAKRRREPKWLNRMVVDSIHTDQLREHGGLSRLRDENALESALARPRQLWQYSDRPDLAMLAAAYAFALVKNHPYCDGNKRTWFLAMITFLGVNGQDFSATEAEVVTQIVALADGTVSEQALADWIRRHTPRRR